MRLRNQQTVRPRTAAAHRDPLRRGLPLDRWPMADQIGWSRAQTGGSPLRRPGRASGWAPSTRKATAGSYARYLGWIERRGDLDPEASIRSLLTAERVEQFLDDPALSCSPQTRVSKISTLRMFAQAVAADVDWTWLAEFEAAARQHVRPVREQRTRLRMVHELVALGERLMDEAFLGRSDLQALLAYRDGLMIALLPLVPLRLKNFADLQLGDSLFRRGSTWWISVAAAATKTKRPYERPFPDRLVPALERYLAEIRPGLMRRHGRWARPIGLSLWVSGHGSPLGMAAIYEQIIERTARAFGKPVNPHLFRHSAVTTLALESPEMVRAGALILGHVDYATTDKHYNLARAVDAARRYHDVLEGLVAKRRRR